MTYQLFEGPIVGFLAMLCSITSLGPQNLLAIQIAACRRNVTSTWLFFALSEAMLILLAILLVDLAANVPIFASPHSKFIGVILLAIMGSSMITSGFKAAQNDNRHLQPKFFTLIVVTFFNPLTYLDTIGLISSLSAAYHKDPVALGLSAWIAAVFWFSTLILVSYRCGSIILKSNAWRYLQCCSGIVMIYFSWKLFCLSL
jgi:L-lysine exporter family protein LysE/ArgO